MWRYYNPIFEYEEPHPDVDVASAWIGHKYFTYDLIRNIKPKVIVELGTHKGASFFSMCQAVKDSKFPCKLYAVDTWKGDKHAGLYNQSVYNEVNKIKDEIYTDLKINLLKKTFDESVGNFKDNSIDLLHIDGLHTFKAVSHDFHNWKIKLKKSAIILFHDTNERGKDFGVYKLWNILKNKYETLEFFHSHGLGIMFKAKNKYFPDIVQFQEIWQHYYPLIFENITLRNQFNINKNALEKTISENTELKRQIKEAHTHIQNIEPLLKKIQSAKSYRL